MGHTLTDNRPVMPHNTPYTDPPLQQPPAPQLANSPLASLSDPTAQAAAQRVMQTSDAFFRKFVNVWLCITAALMVYTYWWDKPSLYAVTIGIGSGLLAKLGLHWGRIQWVRWLFVMPFVLALLIAPWWVNGIRTPLLIHMMMVLVLTGWTLGTRVMWCVASAFATMLLALWWAEGYGLWQAPTDLRGIETWLVAWLFSLLLTTVLMSELIGNYRTDVQREAALQCELHNALHFNTLIIDSSPVPIRVFDAQGQCIAVNPAYAQLLGHSQAELLSHNLQDTAMRRTGLAEQCLHALASGQAAQREIEMTTCDGRMLWLGVHLVPFARAGQRHLLAHFIDLTDHRRATEQLTQQAFHDSLTGLGNRRLFAEHFRRTQHMGRRSRTWGAVLLLDLDRFKQLNDTHGHAAGDAVLQAVAQRLQAGVRASDVVARLGGDEFIVLLQNLGASNQEACLHVAMLRQKLQAALAAPYAIPGGMYRGSASIGAALMDPAQHTGLDEVLQHADAHMYACKKTAAACMAT